MSGAASTPEGQLVEGSPSEAVDQAAFREAIAHFATGVTVITTRVGDQRAGMTASAVASLSLDPVLLLVCINNRLPAHEAIENSRRFVVNVLGEGQEALALQFARPAEDKFAGVALSEDHELPVLADAIAHFVCDVHERFPGGDHSIFTGLVRSCGAVPGKRPLVYFRSAFGSWRDPRAEELDEAMLWPGCEAPDPVPVPPRYRPVVPRSPVTQAAPAPLPGDAAAAAARQDVALAVPQIVLAATPPDDPWRARRDLLSSGSGDRHFVVEIESDGTAALRFGDDTHGMRPRSGTAFRAAYRVGNGAAGNVAAESIGHITTTVGGIAGVRNPLPATGGTDPEDAERVRRFAPVAFRTQERAVTTDDYAAMAGRHAQVQRAAASFRWTGSWRTVFVTADPFDGTPPATGDGPFDPPLPVELEPYRMAGHDLDTSIPIYVPLEIEMAACVKDGYFRSDVKRALLDVFSSRRLPDGRLGLFHADNLTLGQPVYLSPLIAAAYAVDGVESVAVTTFQRQGVPDPRPLQDGRLTFGRLEIPRLANDPSFPERGVFRLTVEGGA